MRFARIDHTEGPRVCAVDDDGAARAVSFSDTGAPVRSLQEIIAAGPNATARLTTAATAEPGKVLAPLIPHRNIFCVGRNYAEHAAEFAASGFDATGSPDGQHVPEYPVVFTKPAATVIATGDPIDPHTDITSALDYEGEIGVIIGKRASKVSKADALDYVWGYTLINDMTARDLQRDHKQWFIGKGLDTFCPLGPWAVTADDVDITNLQLQTSVNGELRQDTNTALLIFDVPTIIETLTAGITLGARRRDRHRHPGRCRDRFRPAEVSAARRRGHRHRDRPRSAAQCHRRPRGAAHPDHLVTAGTHRLFVEKTGTGPAVVLIHGLGGTTTVYDPQVAALAKTHTVLRYDLSGHGRSPYVGSAKHRRLGVGTGRPSRRLGHQ